jgi:hypothetical protein
VPVEIIVSWDNDRGLSSREIHDALNSLLGLSLPNVAGTDQHVEGFIQDRYFSKSAPTQMDF